VQTEITCDYCRSLVVVTRDLTVDELVAPVAPDRQLAYEAATRWLRNEGVQVERLLTREGRFCPVWVLSAQSGEEHQLPARADDPPLLQSLRLPAVPLVARNRQQARVFEPLPEPTVSREEAESAALAAFRDGAAAVQTVRLLWLPIVELIVSTPAGDVDGLYVAGADRLLFAPFPVGATDPPIDTPRVVLYAAFLAVAWLAGAVTDSPWSRVWVEAALAGALLGILALAGRPTSGSPR
jgi:hypothetical protein